DLDQEEQRHVKENLSEEELALFDLLVTKDHVQLTDKEQDTVKKAVRELLDTLKSEKLVLDWRKRQRTRAQVRVTIERLLDKELPRAYTPELYNQVCADVYNHVYERYGSGAYG
ncbi:MAG TPA: type I restriction enzyme endonuclease domain-containing protein, partial [Balneolales bacterium]|nr:type I restriction enzyme endonuclease domain-containing protein [Balneolales bacterium]